MNNYYNEVILKINNFISQKAWNQALVLVKEELSAPYVPRQYQEQFQKLYSDIVFNLKQEKVEKEQLKKFWNLEMIGNILLSSKKEEEHTIALYHLQNYNIRLIFHIIIDSLVNPNISNKNKTRLLILLKNQGISDELKVKKTHGTFKIKPVEFLLWYEMKVYQDINKLLEQKVFSKNPNLFQICIFLLDSYFESLMPQVLNSKHVNGIAAAIYIHACSLQCIEVTLISSARLFHSTSTLIKKYLLELNQHQIA